MEQWKVVPGYNGVYEASDQCRVRRVKGKGCANGKVRYLKIGDVNGYKRVSLMVDGVVFKTGLHNMVAAAFLGPCPDGLEINHIDMDKSNNLPSNLEYITHKRNLELARAMKPAWAKKGEETKNAKITDDDVRAIRTSKESQRALGERYGLSGVAIYYIRARKNWKHVE